MNVTPEDWTAAHAQFLLGGLGQLCPACYCLALYFTSWHDGFCITCKRVFDAAIFQVSKSKMPP